MGKEMVIAHDENEVLSIYQELLDSDEKREKMGECARLRILKDHTYKKRAETINSVLEKIHP